jgi:hypothetical protein
MMSIRKLGLAASAVAIGGIALGVGLSAGTAHAQSAYSISFVSATTTYSASGLTGVDMGTDQALLTFSVTCPAQDAAGYAQVAQVDAAADQGGNGGGENGNIRCTGSPQTVEVTATAVVSTYAQYVSSYETGEYAAGPAFVGGTLIMDSLSFVTSATAQNVVGAVASTAGTETITEGTAS